MHNSLQAHYNLGCIHAGVDNVGTVPAALLTYASIQAIKPDLVINMGTAGGFKVYIPLLFRCINILFFGYCFLSRGSCAANYYSYLNALENVWIG